MNRYALIKLLKATHPNSIQTIEDSIGICPMSLLNLSLIGIDIKYH